MKQRLNIEKVLLLVWLVALTFTTICNCVLIAITSRQIGRVLDFVITNN